MANFKTSNISKLYGDFKALSDINIDIADGEFLTLLGPSGSGKTTLLMILAGFTDPSSGSLHKDGNDISNQPAEERNFGMMFQGYALFPHLSVRQNIEYPLRIRKIPSSERRIKVDKIIQTVGLQEHSEKKPSQLSGGQRQRVALARSLVFEPDMLLLDEPLSALDRNMRDQLRDELKRIHRETGTTFVFVTHDQSEALALSDRIAIFNQGQIVQLDTPQNIYNKPTSLFVAEFLGQINIIPLEEITSDGSFIKCNAHDSILSAPVNPKLNGSTNHVLAIRPEHMILSKTIPENVDNTIKAKIKELTYQGNHTNITLFTNHEVQLSISVPTSNEELTQGEEIWMSWPTDKGRVLAR